MSLYKKIVDKKEKISVVGLGYVGLPLAVAFSKKTKVVGFDLNKEKITKYQNGIDVTNEVGNQDIRNTKVDFTTDELKLRECKFHIVAVPTPINLDKTPDLKPLQNATHLVGRNLTRNSIVVFESTVYPGVTENICKPILEKESGLICGEDFKIGYSPERINPGDKVHTLATICKIVSGMDEETLNEIQNVYSLVIKAGVYPVSSIKTAEAIKIAENSQRDINIAFINELAMVFDRMGIDTNEVIDGMNTKWNALGFKPGLVGGHCIGVDPYYFIYEAERLGYHSQLISAGRKVNDEIGKYVADITIKKMVLTGKAPINAKIAIMGLTFKENCPDIRNSKIIDIVKQLKEYNVNPIIVDPWADKREAEKEYKITLHNIEEIRNVDCIILAVAHDIFKELGLFNINKMYKDMKQEKKIFIDVKGVYGIKELSEMGFTYWRL